MSVFKEQQKLGSKTLLTFQFARACANIVAWFVFTDNALYLKNRDYGYTQTNIFSVPVATKAQFNGRRDADFRYFLAQVKPGKMIAVSESLSVKW